MALISPKPTLSLVASLFNQNPTQLSTTIRVQGTYTCSNTGVTCYIDIIILLDITSDSFIKPGRNAIVYNAPHDPSHPDTGALTWMRKYPVCLCSRKTTCSTENTPVESREKFTCTINHREYFMETEIFLTPSLVCRP